ncbi:MAG: hypothetical protein ACM3KR_03040 [Deltaproteobacteria bacterium]
MIKKFVFGLIFFIVVLIFAGLFAVNYLFDKYLAEPEVIEDLVKDMSENAEFEKMNLKLAESGFKKVQVSRGKMKSQDNDSSKNINSIEKKINKNHMENIDNYQNVDNNVKRSKGKIKIDPADKARVISILKSSLTSSDIQELKKIAANRPLTSEKIARAKAILKARLSSEQKNELKAIYRKYYG